MKSKPRLLNPAVSIKRVLMAWMLLICPLAQGGSVPAASSAIPGVLLIRLTLDPAEGEKAYFGIEHSKGFVQLFRQACARKQRIWALGVSGTVVCSQFEHLAEGGDGPVYAVHLHSKAPLVSQARVTVISLAPVAHIAPKKRKLSKAEIDGIGSAHPSGPLRLAVEKALAAGTVRSIDFDGLRSSVYIVKWKRIVEPELDLANDHYLVINRLGEKYQTAGSFEGDIVRFLDVDKDGRPDVQRSVSCDGICEAVTTLVGRTEDLVSISNH